VNNFIKVQTQKLIGKRKFTNAHSVNFISTIYFIFIDTINLTLGKICTVVTSVMLPLAPKIFFKDIMQFTMRKCKGNVLILMHILARKHHYVDTLCITLEKNHTHVPGVVKLTVPE
jgi:hypothetical protein